MKSALTSLTGAALIFLLVLGAYTAWYERVASYSTEVSKLQNELAKKKETIARITMARTILQQQNDPAHNSTNYFVAQANVAPFISLMESLANDGGTSLEVMGVSASGTAKPVPTLSFTLGIDGEFEPLLQTLGAIEQMPYATSFSGLTIAKGERDVWHAEVRMLVGSTQ